MNRLPRFLTVIALMAALPAFSADAKAGPQADPRAHADTLVLGQRVFNHWCLPCHGRGPGRYGIGETGTTAIQVKYEGKVPAVLEDRTDLTPEMVAVFVRRGINTMPFFRRTEISDAELAAIGAYLAQRPSAAAAAAPTATSRQP